MNGLSDLLTDSPILYTLREKVKEYYKDEANRKKFEDWYRAKFGKDYEWRKTHEQQITRQFL